MGTFVLSNLTVKTAQGPARVVAWPNGSLSGDEEDSSKAIVETAESAEGTDKDTSKDPQKDSVKAVFDSGVLL